jgi:hypothetical protein
LDADLPETRDGLSQIYPGAPYEEALRRQVIEHARSFLCVRAPDLLENVVTSLEEELQAHLECEAVLRWPGGVEFITCPTKPMKIYGTCVGLARDRLGTWAPAPAVERIA